MDLTEIRIQISGKNQLDNRKIVNTAWSFVIKELLLLFKRYDNVITILF